MRFSSVFLALALAATHAAAQNETLLQELVQEFQNLNLTSLINATSVINSTTTGQDLLGSLGSGPVTIFAPNNDAFAGLLPNISSSPQLLAEVLSYHFVPGTFDVTATYPNTTIGRTLLNSSDLVFLEGSKHQVLAWADVNGTVSILNQNTPSVVVNTSTFGNFTLQILSAVIDVPGPLDAALFANNLTSFTTAAQAANVLQPLNITHGVTIFAPNDAAFSAAQANLSSAGSNTTLLTNVLNNHVIQGETVYSGNLIGLGSGTNLTTAAGEGLSASFNTSGGFVTVGNATAKIVTPDIVLWNGVLHIIDTVLFYPESDASAASSAASSAAAAATSSVTESGPIGFTQTSASSTGTAGGNNAAGSGSSAGLTADIPLAQLGLASMVGMLGIIFGAVLAL